MENTSTNKKGAVIAVTGKGGTGKTVLSALMVKVLVGEGKQSVLAIDADSAVSLPHALGVEVKRTVGQIRDEVINDPAARKELESQHIREGMKSCLHRGAGFDLLLMGRGEGPGCFCSVNDLLRYGIDTLSKEYDVTVVDGEAGPEQINRRVVPKIDVLMMVTDTSSRAFRTAGLIQEIAKNDQALELGKKGLVINKVKGREGELQDAATALGLEIFGYIPDDENVTAYDFRGDPVIDLPSSSPSVTAVENLLKKIGL